MPRPVTRSPSTRPSTASPSSISSSVESSAGLKRSTDALRTAGARRGLVLRPLRPALHRELLLVQRRDRPADPALEAARGEIVRALAQR